MFFKDTLRLIRKTFNRFFSLVMIVLIGVAFMMGLMSTSTVMRESVDQYNDDNSLQDIQLYSSYGFCQEDVDGLKDVDNVEDIFASKMVDAYCKRSDGDIVVARVEEAERSINRYTLISGRDPVKENEIVVLANSIEQSNYVIGDTLELYLEDGDLSDNLSVTEYVIVGLAQSSAYTSKVLSTSNLDNRDLEVVLYVPNENFVFEYYTTIYLTISGAKDKMSYTTSYSDFIAESIDDLEGYSYKQQDYLKAELLDKYTKEIQDNEKLLLEKKEEGQKKLDDAKEQLDEARIKIIYAETAIETNKATLDSSSLQLKENEKLLKENEAKVNDALDQIEEKSGQSFDTIYEEVSTAYTTYIAIENQIAAGGASNNDTIKKQKEQLAKEKADNLARISEIEEVELPKINKEIDLLQAQIDALDSSAEDYSEKLEELNSMLASLNEQKSSLESEANSLKARNTVIESIESALSDDNLDEVTASMQAMLDEMDSQFKEYGFEGTKDAYTQLTALKKGIEQIESGKKQIESGKAEIEAGYKQLNSAKKTIEESKKKYEDGLKEYTDGVITFNQEIEKAENEIQKAYQDLEELPAAKWMVLDRDSHYSSLMYDNTCKQMGAIGVSMPLLFYLVAALVCMTTMTRLVDEQRGQIGVFRALGFSKAQVISKYIQYSLMASLIGSVFGIVLGIFTFPVVIYKTWRLMYYLPEMKLVVPMNIVIVCILAFSVLMMIVTFFVVRKTLEEVPSQLLRPKAPKNAKEVFLEKIKFIWNRLSFTGKITARNLIRYKTRFFMTVIGVAGCTALLVVGYGVKDSIADIIKIQFSEIFSYDYNMNLENDHEAEAIIAELNSNLENEVVVPYMQYMTKTYTNGKEATAYAMVVDARNSSSIFGFRLSSDKETVIKLNNNGVLVSEKFAKNNNIKAGDYITIESSNGLKASVKVNEICEMYFQHYIFISEDYYRTVFNQEPHYSIVAVKTSDGEALQSVMDEHETIISITDFSGLIAQFEIMIEALDLIIIVIILTAGSLAFVVLINLTQVNVSERIREIATLKVLGFNNKEVDMYIFKEIFFLTVIGGLAGLPLGVVFHHFIMNIINMDMVMFGMNIRFTSFAYSFVITIVFTIIVLMFTKKTLRQVEMIESLKSVE